MSLSSIIKKTCPTCNKVAIESDRYSFGDATIVQLVCGHSIVEETLTISNYDTVISSDGRSLMPFQVTGVKFAEKANARVLIADEQGLGKTIQAIAMLKLHPELLPAVITCKTSLKAQWFHEIIRWTGGKDSYLTQVIGSSKEKPIPYAFGIYIITYDILKTEGLFDSIGIKTVILDECQAIKNHLSGRAKAVQSVAKDAEHIIALSGTPIKNHAGEYFTILNLLQPSRFPEFNRFLRDDCDSYETMYGYKVGGLARPDEFREKTQDFIIRRTQKEVLPDLPELNRQFYHVELDRRLNKAYADGLAELDDLLYSEENENTMTSMIAIMTKLRKITGISKVTEAIDFVTEFLLNTDRKIVVFAHHHDAVNLLDASLSKWLSDGGFKKPLNLHAGLNGEARAELVKKFQSEDYRIMIAR